MTENSRNWLSNFSQKHLLVPKALYFVMNLSFYSCYTFRPKYLKQAFGIETKEYALIASFLSLVSFISGYIWSYIVDKTGYTKNVLILTSVSSAVVFQFFLIQSESLLANGAAKYTFVTIISGLYIFFVSAFIPVLDALVIKMLTSLPNSTKELYGRQRLWGTIAYASISLIVSSFGKLVPALNILIVGMSAIFAGSCIFLLPRDDPLNSKKKKVDEGIPASKNSSKSPMIRLFTNGNFVFLLLVVFANGLARNVMTHFLEPIQRDVFKTPSEYTGLSTVSGVFFEIVVFFFAKKLLLKLGVRRMLLVAQFGMVARVSCYAFLPTNYEFVRYMPIFYEFFKGLSFGFMHAAGVQLATEIAPPELKSTAQAVFTGVFSGLSACIAGIFGYLLQNMASKDNSEPESQKMFRMLRITSYISIAAFFVFFIKYIIIDEILYNDVHRPVKDEPKKAKLTSIELETQSSAKV